jgi:hypothetical protein
MRSSRKAFIARWRLAQAAMSVPASSTHGDVSSSVVTAAWRRLRGRANRIASAGVIRAHSL